MAFYTKAQTGFFYIRYIEVCLRLERDAQRRQNLPQLPQFTRITAGEYHDLFTHWLSH